MYMEHIPHEEYAPLAKRFAPKKYDPDSWVDMAKEAGMEYMVLTTRHHDGFSLFDSQVSDFTAPKTGAKRDLVREYVEACHRGGMRVGFYYSLLDWRYPAYFRGPKTDPQGWKDMVDYVHAQVRELCSNYGKVDILWYDGGWPYTAEDWRSQELNAMVRQLQQDIIINDRSQLPEDFDTPEQHIQSSEPGRPWEACMTLNDNWGYCEADDNWKTPKQVLQNLVRCANGGGNLLLNVGPESDGTIPKESIRILREVGKWLHSSGGSVYGTDRSPIHVSTGLSTIKGNTFYMHVFRWPGKEIHFAQIVNKVRSVHLLESGEKVKFEQKGDRVLLSGLPSRAPNELDTVIVMEVEGEPQALDYFAQARSAVPEPAVEEEAAAAPGGEEAPESLPG